MMLLQDLWDYQPSRSSVVFGHTDRKSSHIPKAIARVSDLPTSAAKSSNRLLRDPAGERTRHVGGRWLSAVVVLNIDSISRLTVFALVFIVVLFYPCGLSIQHPPDTDGCVDVGSFRHLAHGYCGFLKQREK